MCAVIHFIELPTPFARKGLIYSVLSVSLLNHLFNRPTFSLNWYLTFSDLLFDMWCS